MPEFLRIVSVKFYVHSREESRPHIHVKVQEFTAKVWLDSFEVAKSNASKKLESKIVKLVLAHKEDLLNSWYDYFGGEDE